MLLVHSVLERGPPVRVRVSLQGNVSLGLLVRCDSGNLFSDIVQYHLFKSLIIKQNLVFQFIMHHKQRVEEINVKVEALTKDLISQKIFEEMEDVLMWEDLPDEVK